MENDNHKISIMNREHLWTIHQHKSKVSCRVHWQNFDVMWKTIISDHELKNNLQKWAKSRATRMTFKTCTSMNTKTHNLSKLMWIWYILVSIWNICTYLLLASGCSLTADSYLSLKLLQLFRIHVNLSLRKSEASDPQPLRSSRLQIWRKVLYDKMNWTRPASKHVLSVHREGRENGSVRFSSFLRQRQLPEGQHFRPKLSSKHYINQILTIP